MLSLLKKHWPAVVALLFALGAALGLLQRGQDPYTKTPPQQTTQQADQKSLEAYYQQAKQLAQDGNAETTTSFLAVGDIMLSRSVASAIESAGRDDLPFQNIRELLKSADFNFGNLESPISGSDKYGKTGSLVFNAPEKYARPLKDFNFKVLNLANNHAMDQGKDGLFHTINFLDELGLRHTGAGTNQEEAWQPVVITANGIKTCFVGASYASANDNGKTTNNFVARIEDEKNLKKSLSIAKKDLACDFTVVTMHAGVEYTRGPNAAQKKFARTAVDLGADMVIGAHPHWIQTVEKYCPGLPENGPQVTISDKPLQYGGCKYIFYSLGNFIFDQEWSQDTKEGLAIKVNVAKKSRPAGPEGAASLETLQGTAQKAELKSIELWPVVIENFASPRLATEQEKTEILKKIGLTATILK